MQQQQKKPTLLLEKRFDRICLHISTAECYTFSEIMRFHSYTLAVSLPYLKGKTKWSQTSWRYCKKGCISMFGNKAGFSQRKWMAIGNWSVILRLDGIQRRMTKIIKQVKDYSYWERLKNYYTKKKN